MKKIFFAASECVPFIKTGGLADVCGALPKAFDHRYWDVRVVIPNYSCIPEHYRNQFEYVTHFYMGSGNYIKSKYVGVLQYKQDGVTYYFINNQEYTISPADMPNKELDYYQITGQRTTLKSEEYILIDAQTSHFKTDNKQLNNKGQVNNKSYILNGSGTLNGATIVLENGKVVLKQGNKTLGLMDDVMLGNVKIK